jgi:hypothetical protein
MNYLLWQGWADEITEIASRWTQVDDPEVRESLKTIEDMSTDLNIYCDRRMDG